MIARPSYPVSNFTYSKGFPFKFPAGETQVRVDVEGLMDVLRKGAVPFIYKKILSADDIMEILMTSDALRRAGVTNLELLIPYVPYSRQDRVMVSGESLGIKVFADMINSANFNRVIIQDPHSDVTTALIDRCYVVEQHTLCIQELDSFGKSAKDFILVCPDSGARKKTLKLASASGSTNIVYADKIRDPASGAITGTTINLGSLDSGPVNQEVGYEFLIVDDICEGGRTFIEIAKELKKQLVNTPHTISLFVTHGFFSKGLDEISEYIGTVYCSNVMTEDPAVLLHPTLKGSKSL